MTESLGKIEKPEAVSFSGKRKLYLVPLIFSGEDSPAEYVALYNRYWEQVSQHIASLESKIGKATHVYCEMVSLKGENGLKVVESINSSCYRIMLDKCQSGAALEATDDKELADESMDWQRCLLVGLLSQKAADMVSRLYVEALRQRYTHIARSIGESLKENEVGILFIQEGHMVQFPADIEVFTIAPPSLDEIRRWLREQSSRQSGK